MVPKQQREIDSEKAAFREYCRKGGEMGTYYLAYPNERPPDPEPKKERGRGR